MELETINKLYLELSQVATAKTANELNLERQVDFLLLKQATVQNGYVTVDISILNTEWLAAACREAGIVRNIGATPETIIGAAIHGYLLAASKGGAV